MNLDEQFLEMTDKIRLIEQVNENVRLISEIQNSKRRVFTRLFFISTKIKVMNE
jgi:hypothetical protein